MAHDGSDWDWAGALIVNELANDISFLRQFAEAYAKGMKRSARKNGRR